MLVHPGYDLDWNLVRTFVSVDQAGSLAAGARSLGITHPTAARHIQQLESALGVSLFSRTAQGLILNEAGERLRAAAKVMHQSALAFQAATDAMRARPVERIRVSVAEMLAELLPDIMLSELSDDTFETPSIDMVVTNDTVNLLERDADIALRHVRPDQQELLCRRVGQLEMGVFAHRDYVAQFGFLDLEHLNQHRFIDGITRDYVTRRAAQRGLTITTEQIVLRSDSVSCQRAAVRAGWGIAAFPLWMAQDEAEWVSVFADDEIIDIEVWLVARPEVRDSNQLNGVFKRLGDGLAQRLS